MTDTYAHGESIYNIIPPKEIQQQKGEMYRSRFSPRIPPTGTTFGGAQTTHPACMNIAGTAGEQIVANKSGRTMGHAPGSARNNPEDYMKKNTNLSQVKTLAEVKKTQPHLLHPTELKPKLKPDVPKKNDLPPMNLVTSKNFVVANAVETILATPKKLSARGKEYLAKEDFGKVPRYLKNIKQDIQAEYDYIRQLQAAEDERLGSQVRPMDEDERLKLIVDLKAKWESVNTVFQGGTHLTILDTAGKISRKEKAEASLAQIEKDIEKLNRRNIMVSRDY